MGPSVEDRGTRDAASGRAGPGSRQEDVRRLIEAATALMSGEGSVLTDHARSLRELNTRLQEGRFHLAILGQFKRGKSSFVNGLLGEPLLPTAIVPLTALPTFVRAGVAREAAVHFENDRPPAVLRAGCAADVASFIGQYVAESSNPRNREDVERVEVRHPAALLMQGVVLIDTPGIGSTFRHNTEATLNFLPQCDAALFILSADPPITEVEVAFLKEVARKVRRIAFVVNKADQVSAEDQRMALEFLRRVIAESASVTGEAVIFPVSSRWALEAREKGDAELWTRSGMESVERYLLAFLATEKTAELCAVIARKAASVAADACMELRLSVQSLELPVVELEKRLKRFDQKIAEAEQQRISAGDLLAGSSNRMVTLLEEQAEGLRKKYRKALHDTVERTFAEAGAPDEGAARNALAEVIPIFFERELGDLSRSFNERVAETLRPHEKRAADIIEEVRRYAAQLFEIPYRAPESESAYVTVSEPYWVTHKWSSSLIPLPEGFFDRLLPISWQHKRINKRFDARIEDLVVSNVENLRWSTLQNLGTSFRRFAADLDERLRLTVDATRGAIRAAMEKRRSHADSIADEVKRLQVVLVHLDRITSDLSALSPSEGNRERAAKGEEDVR